ncbi:DEAD/DEAH box helicase [Rhizobium sp. 0TCS1.26]|uniref:DEAD/DEAH box helicase n=1 Tax=Rhizobium sp. 0TCS1.26 TaxID=3142623 RepID=UPI003D2B696A
MRVIEYPGRAEVDRPKPTSRPAAALIAAKLIETFETSDRSRVYVALSESSAGRIADAIRCLDPDLDIVVLPPWDCLPYDRVPPSRQSMGRRMDALRVWLQPSTKPRLLITSLDAGLQRVPPATVVRDSWFKLAVGDLFDREAFDRFVRRTGYIEDGIVDEPGELAFRDDVIDIFPAGASVPMRIILDEDTTISELRSYDPGTQRTTNNAEVMVFGPASEAVTLEADLQAVDEAVPQCDVSERRLFQVYGELSTVFDLIGDADIAFEDGYDDRLSSYLDIIEEARQARRRFDGEERSIAHSLYLNRSGWTSAVSDRSRFDLDFSAARALPKFSDDANPRRMFLSFVRDEKQSGRTVVLAGSGENVDRLTRRLERDSDTKVQPLATFKQWAVQDPGALLKLACPLDRGFADGPLSVVTVRDILGELAEATEVAARLAEPELQLGDVVVHEDHGIGVLKSLDTVTVEDVVRDAARLEYRDGASLLVPMDEFGKLWRYGSEPEAVTLDRLHTEAWSKRRAEIDTDIRTAARHLMRLAKQRRDATAEAFVPPRAEYAKFARRFPYTETAHQIAAIDALLQDLASGTVMSRLICGDVGFGKTEVALRAAAAVALAGGQVVLIAPTTVLARQHFTTFERRFAGTGIHVAMLSRVVEPKLAKEVKEGLASGAVGIVVATQAILAKDVRFAHLGLLIVDEEHRFGTREKQAMKAMAPLLHTLTMSATPIPRTLQSAMIGVQDVSILATAPSKRRPVRTSLTPVDRAAMRVALMREYRRGGQSFLVVPQIEDLDPVRTMLGEIVPELSLRVAHGKMKAAEMDEVMVRFADGDGDVLLSTNIIESGLDVPRANTIFIWRSDRFGLAQLHQLRGRVGRGKAQGMAYLTTESDELPEETRLRLATMVENDRLGAGLAISMQDLDLRGAGDIAGEDQAGHMRLIGVSLYQKLLERAVKASAKSTSMEDQAAALNLGIAGTIPQEYVSDAAVRLNLYARLFRAADEAEIDRFVEEFEDRFGELPDEVSTLFRLARLRIRATRLGIAKVDGGPRALALTFTGKPAAKTLKLLTRSNKADLRDGRLIFEQATATPAERMALVETLLSDP